MSKKETQNKVEKLWAAMTSVVDAVNELQEFARSVRLRLLVLERSAAVHAATHRPDLVCICKHYRGGHEGNHGEGKCRGLVYEGNDSATGVPIYKLCPCEKFNAGIQLIGGK